MRRDIKQENFNDNNGTPIPKEVVTIDVRDCDTANPITINAEVVSYGDDMSDIKDATKDGIRLLIAHMETVIMDLKSSYNIN